MAFLPKKFMMIMLFVAVALYFIGSGSSDDSQKNSVVVSQVMPKASFVKKRYSAQAQKGYGEVLIRISAYGQYLTEARVNSYSVNFLVDTGANIIALTYEDAINIGIDVRGLDFKVEVQTAAGVTKVASVVIENISIEFIEYRNLHAVVFKQDELSVSLLGMNFLNKLSSFKFENNNLIMEQ